MKVCKVVSDEWNSRGRGKYKQKLLAMVELLANKGLQNSRTPKGNAYHADVLKRAGHLGHPMVASVYCSSPRAALGSCRCCCPQTVPG